MERQNRTDVSAPLLGLLTAGLAAMLALGFLPTAARAAELLALALRLDGPGHETARLLGFPALALLFYVSLPRSTRRVSSPHTPARTLVEISALPLLISFVYGYFISHPSIWQADRKAWPLLLWYLILAPVGEELLFRGWVYSLIEKLSGGKSLTLTNPFPIALWASAFAFSMWHFQNASRDPWVVVTFQVGYTFLAGIWLGYLRWQSGRVSVAIFAHILLNLFAALA